MLFYAYSIEAVSDLFAVSRVKQHVAFSPAASFLCFVLCLLAFPVTFLLLTYMESELMNLTRAWNKEKI